MTAATTFARSMGQVFGVAVFGAVFSVALAAQWADRREEILHPLNPIVRSAVESVSPLGAGGVVAFGDVSAIDRLPGLAPADREAAAEAVGRLERAHAISVTGAIRLLYRIGIGVVLAGLLITARMPELALEVRTGGGGSRAAHPPG